MPRSFQARTSAWAGPASVTAPRAEANARRRPAHSRHVSVSRSVGRPQRPHRGPDEPHERRVARRGTRRGPGARQERHRAGAKSALTSTLRACPLLHPHPSAPNVTIASRLRANAAVSQEPGGIVARMARHRQTAPLADSDASPSSRCSQRPEPALAVHVSLGGSNHGTSSAAAPTVGDVSSEARAFTTPHAPAGHRRRLEAAAARRGRGAVSARPSAAPAAAARRSR